MIVGVYEKASLELGLKGWEETMSVVSQEYTKATWKRSGEVGDWEFAMEYNREKCTDKVMCVMCLNIGKAIGCKCDTPIYALDVMGIDKTLEALRKGVVLLLHKTMKGGQVCQML